MRLESIPSANIPDDLAAWYGQAFEQAGGAGHYQAIAYRHPHERERMQLALAALSDLPHGYCLEIGCNEGRMTRELAKRFKSVHAMDFNPAALAACPKLPNVTYALRDATEGEGLGFDYDEFEYDVIVCANVLEHVRDPQVLIAKCIPHCKYLVASCPTSEPLNAERAFDVGLIGKEERIGDASGHIWAMDAEGFMSLFDRYTLISVSGISHGAVAVVRGGMQ